MLIYVRPRKVHGPGLCTHQFLSKGNNEDIFGHFSSLSPTPLKIKSVGLAFDIVEVNWSHCCHIW